LICLGQTGDKIRRRQGAAPKSTGKGPMTTKQIIPSVSIAMLRGNRVLLVRRGQAPSRGLYAFPGGRVEPGETLEAAARRELLEETGLEAGELSPLSKVLVEGDSADYDLQIFAGRYAGGEPLAASDAAEAGFFTRTAIERLEVMESVLKVCREILAPLEVQRQENPRA
jgi:8-oxo-dGTP diphosphatase